LPGERPQHAPTATSKAAQRAVLRKVMTNRDLWLFSLLYCFFALVFSSVLTWAPTYFFTVKHQSLAFSSQLVGLVPMVGIIGAPVAGWMHSRTSSAKTLIVLPMALLAVAAPLILYVRTDLLLPFMVVVGLVAAFVPTSLFIVVGRVVHDNKLSGMAMGVIATGFNAGALAGPAIFGYALDRVGGWETPFWLLLPLGLAGVLAGLLARVDGSRTAQSP
jgi:MFS transporter, ACS family, hexuronate transporter